MNGIVHHLIENVNSEPLELSKSEVSELEAQGEWFASRGENEQGTVIRCTWSAEGKCQVRVENHVGALRVGDHTFIISPKISFKHFEYIVKFDLGLSLPKSREEDVGLNAYTSFHDLVAKWFIDDVRKLAPQFLVRDYRSHSEILTQVRGKVKIASSSRKWLTGNLLVDCEFEEFDLDHPINRVIKAALNRLQYASFLHIALRSDATRLYRCMNEVSPLQPGDRRVVPDRRYKKYGTAYKLAGHVLDSQGRSITEGTSYSRAFLFRTPLLIENVNPNILAQDLKQNSVSVEKLSTPIPPQGDADPDLVFNKNELVGDVKYKVEDSWSNMRDDMYQSVFFAAAFRTFQSIIIAFTKSQPSVLNEVRVGDHRLNGFLWAATDDTDPLDQRSLLTNFIRRIISGVPVQEIQQD